MLKGDQFDNNQQQAYNPRINGGKNRDEGDFLLDKRNLEGGNSYLNGNENPADLLDIGYVTKKQNKGNKFNPN